MPKPITQPTTAQFPGTLLKSARDVKHKDKGINGDRDRLPRFPWITNPGVGIKSLISKTKNENENGSVPGFYTFLTCPVCGLESGSCVLRIWDLEPSPIRFHQISSR
jgi:hypothetical protein